MKRSHRGEVGIMVLVGLVACLGPFAGGIGWVSPAYAGGGHNHPDVISVTTLPVIKACDAQPCSDEPGLLFSFEVCNDDPDNPLEEVEIKYTLPPGLVPVPGCIVGGHDCNAPTGGYECPCEGGVTFLRLRYNGLDGAHVTVEDDNVIIFDAILNDGATFELNGTRSDGRFQKNNLIFTVDDVDTVIHVSCSQPIGIGLVYGPFTIEAFGSRNGGTFEDVCEPPPPACPCDGGVTSLTLRFNGPDGTHVTVEDDNVIIFEADLNDGGVFQLDGSRSDGRFQKNNLVLTAGGQDTTIHVSCSQPIGVGYVFGPFTVEAFSSRNGGTWGEPCDGGEPGGDPSKGHKVEICLDAPIPPGACVTITLRATFADAFCPKVEVSGKIGNSKAKKAKVEECVGGELLNEMLACVCAEAPTGACCFLDQDDCAEGWTQADCNAQVDGAYLGDGATCPADSCCPPGGGDPLVVECAASCEDVLGHDQCVSNNRDRVLGLVAAAEADFWAGTCGSCCPTEVGACCYWDDDAWAVLCSPDVTLSECIATGVYGGAWAGPGTSCDGDFCSQFGACCFGDGSCDDFSMDLELCHAWGGVWAGEGATCDAVDCGVVDPPYPPHCEVYCVTGE